MASRDLLARVYRERFALELEMPDLEAGRTLPFNLTGALFFSGSWGSTASAVRAGPPTVSRRRWRREPPAGTSESLRTLRRRDRSARGQSRKHLPMALAATEPDRAVREIEALEREASSARLSSPKRAPRPSSGWSIPAPTRRLSVWPRGSPGDRRRRSRIAAKPTPRHSIPSIASACWRSTGSVQTPPGAVRTRPPAGGGAQETASRRVFTRNWRGSARGGAGLMPFRRPPLAGRW